MAAQSAVAHLGAGLRLFDQQRYSEAAREFQAALQADPTLENARYHLAVSYFNQKHYSLARAHFEKLESTGFRKNWVSYYLGRLDLAEGRTDAAIRRFDSLKLAPPLEDELYYLGQAYMKQGDPARAAGYLVRQTQFNPRDFRAHYLLAEAYQKNSHPQQAKREFAEAERLHAYYAQGSRELLECRRLLEAGRKDEAWARCRDVLRTDDIDKLVSVGMLFGELGESREALEALARAFELDPRSPEVNYDVGYTQFRLKDYPQARRYLEAAIRLRPDFFEALALEGTVLRQLGDDASARKTLERAHELRPEDAEVTKLLDRLTEGH